MGVEISGVWFVRVDGFHASLPSRNFPDYIEDRYGHLKKKWMFLSSVKEDQEKTEGLSAST